MKTGCQWRELCISEYFDKGTTSWQNIHRYFLKWSKDGSFKRVWINLLSCNKKLLDLSSVQLDGSHTPVKRGGQAVGYQGRKASKTSNSLFLCDNTGQMLAISEAQSGEHNDLYDIVRLFKEMIGVLDQADINCKGLFINADPGFDSEDLKQVCSENEIELNVKPNQRNKNNKVTSTDILMINFIKDDRKSNMQMHGWMHLRHYLSGMKNLLKHGWHCNGWLL